MLTRVGVMLQVLFWDTSAGTRPVASIKAAHGTTPDVHCVDWSGLDEHLVATGEATPAQGCGMMTHLDQGVKHQDCSRCARCLVCAFDRCLRAVGCEGAVGFVLLSRSAVHNTQQEVLGMLVAAANPVQPMAFEPQLPG